MDGVYPVLRGHDYGSDICHKYVRKQEKFPPSSLSLLSCERSTVQNSKTLIYSLSYLSLLFSFLPIRQNARLVLKPLLKKLYHFGRSLSSFGISSNCLRPSVASVADHLCLVHQA